MVKGIHKYRWISDYFEQASVCNCTEVSNERLSEYSLLASELKLKVGETEREGQMRIDREEGKMLVKVGMSIKEVYGKNKIVDVDEEYMHLLISYWYS